jgi:hypothetical protein
MGVQDEGAGATAPTSTCSVSNKTQMRRAHIVGVVHCSASVQQLPQALQVTSVGSRVQWCPPHLRHATWQRNHSLTVSCNKRLQKKKAQTQQPLCLCRAHIVGVVHCGALVQQLPQALQVAIKGSQVQGCLPHLHAPKATHVVLIAHRTNIAAPAPCSPCRSDPLQRPCPAAPSGTQGGNGEQPGAGVSPLPAACAHGSAITHSQCLVTKHYRKKAQTQQALCRAHIVGVVLCSAPVQQLPQALQVAILGSQVQWCAPILHTLTISSNLYTLPGADIAPAAVTLHCFAHS